MNPKMEKRALGKTGLQVSAMGFGSGGFSRAGLEHGEAHAVKIVRAALEGGLILVDSAEAYGTETAVGKALGQTPRENVVLSSKVSTHENDNWRTGQQMRAAIDARLRALNTDHLDVLHLHAVLPDDYARACEEFMPLLQEAQSAGKIRFLGLTERFVSDSGHRTLQRALRDDFWDVFMVGFHLLNQSARARVLEIAAQKQIGILVMFAVRGPLRDEESLESYLSQQQKDGRTTLDAGEVAAQLREILARTGENLPDLAYRFARDEVGVSSVLVGTGNLEHLRENCAAFERAPLSDEIRARLRALAGDDDGLCLQ